jgi:hypothetical protein
MTHPTLRDLTEAAHGLAPRPSHRCDACDATAARLEDELDLLRRADARLAPPRRVAKPRGAWLPFVAAAAVLATIIAAIVLSRPRVEPPRFAQDEPKKEPTTAELVQAFLDGKSDAEKAIRARGAAALPALADARLRKRDAKNYEKLLALHYDIKRATWSDPALAKKLETMKMDLAVAGGSLDDMLDFIRDFTAVNLVVDPGSDSKGGGSLKLSDSSLRATLDSLTAPCELDYDFRYGVLWIAKPERLWAEAKPAAPAAPLTDAQKKTARAWIDKLGSESPDERDQAARELRKLGPAALPLVEEGAKSKDAEVASQCKALVEALTPRAFVTPLPASNAWAAAALKGDENKEIADKLRGMRLTINMENATLAGVLDYVRELSGLNLVIDAAVDSSTKLGLKAADVPLFHAVELLTLPYGLDAKIEGGALTIFKREKP